MKSKLYLPLLLSFFVLTSCEEFLECAFDIDPEINENTIASATLGEEYFQIITAEVDNAANDNAFDYFFEIYGDIPEGIDIIYFARRIEFIGRPLETGTFNFRVYLYVESFRDGYFDSSPTCSDDVSKDFSLVVVE
ncbi:hypothetical protein BTO05_03980 [Winogradskyella sp. PC-19]|uniref:hypothetical protein n=1 Tax=unclassified Winogradskyella TaxID=2615021 RepID=UPI000B3D0AB4|nr:MULTISPECIES: hypothetical protein [unclassified Winogradskyella]ARV08838.1 hypothetical protein BTO05_03980 [Winogradskyella sp. PC-19]